MSRDLTGVWMCLGAATVAAGAAVLSDRGSQSSQPSLFGRKADLERDQQLPVPDAWRPTLARLVRDGEGSTHRLTMRSDVEMVPRLVELGFVTVVGEVPPEESGAPWPFVDVRVTPRLVSSVRRAREARSRYAEEILQVGLFGPKGDR